MGLLQPEAGLLFWMTLAFAVVFILLAKFGFPVILRSIDSRKEFIDSSLDAAREAERKLASLRAEGDAILEEAARERTELLHGAAARSRRKADEEGERIVAAARAKAEAEREAILQDARHQVALLSIAVTEKMLRAKLDDEQAQTRLAEAMLDEMERRKTQKEA